MEHEVVGAGTRLRRGGGGGRGKDVVGGWWLQSYQIWTKQPLVRTRPAYSAGCLLVLCRGETASFPLSVGAGGGFF